MTLMVFKQLLVGMLPIVFKDTILLVQRGKLVLIAHHVQLVQQQHHLIQLHHVLHALQAIIVLHQLQQMMLITHQSHALPEIIVLLLPVLSLLVQPETIVLELEIVQLLHA
jgi:hypothetical protein